MSRVKPGAGLGLSKRSLGNFTAPVEVMPQGDARIDVLANTIVHYERRDDFVREIHGLWKRAQTTFLTIGKYLALAKAKLPHGEFEHMIERDLPFSPTTARQIRAAAEAVTSGRLVATSLPQNYSTLYQLSTLPDDALKQAKQSGLLRPDVRRAEILAFKKKLQSQRKGQGQGQGQVLVPAAKDVELAELRRQLATIETRKTEIAARIAQLEAESE